MNQVVTGNGITAILIKTLQRLNRQGLALRWWILDFICRIVLPKPFFPAPRFVSDQLNVSLMKADPKDHLVAQVHMSERPALLCKTAACSIR